MKKRVFLRKIEKVHQLILSGEKMGQYFIKNMELHKVPPKCGVERMGEKIYGSPPKNYAKCKKCFELSFKS